MEESEHLVTQNEILYLEKPNASAIAVKRRLCDLLKLNAMFA